MPIFISYARKDTSVVEKVKDDLERARYDTWLDEELTGGEAWWNAILEQIRGCDIFVFALSEDALRSKACQAELAYAIALQRPLLPVMVKRVSIQLAPAPIANAQIIDYTERTAENAIALVTAASNLPRPGPLPEPLPPAPPPPLSYMNPLREQVFARDLSFREQAQIVLELRNHLDDDDERPIAAQLLEALRSRRDIAESVGREVDELLAGLPDDAAPTTIGPATTGASDHPGAQPAAGWFPDPTRRHEQRYWDGTEWSEHVVDGGRRSVDPIRRGGAAGSAETAATATGSGAGTSPATGAGVSSTSSGTTGPGKLSDGAFIGLIIGALFIGLIGIIAGGVNMKHEARRGQAQVLLWVGVASLIIGLALVSSGG